MAALSGRAAWRRPAPSPWAFASLRVAVASGAPAATLIVALALTGVALSLGRVLPTVDVSSSWRPRSRWSRRR